MSYSGYDWLEQEYYGNEPIFYSMSDEEASQLRVVKAAMERDANLRNRIQTEGFAGFTKWLETHCRDIYYKLQSALESIWLWIKSKFNF